MVYAQKKSTSISKNYYIFFSNSLSACRYAFIKLINYSTFTTSMVIAWSWVYGFEQFYSFDLIGAPQVILIVFFIRPCRECSRIVPVSFNTGSKWTFLGKHTATIIIIYWCNRVMYRKFRVWDYDDIKWNEPNFGPTKLFCKKSNSMTFPYIWCMKEQKRNKFNGKNHSQNNYAVFVHFENEHQYWRSN